ncbi:MAG: ATP-binding protein [Gemmatimonadaceae bacterium]
MEQTLSSPEQQAIRGVETSVPIPTHDADGERRREGDETARRRDAVLRAVAAAATRFLGCAESWEENIEEVLGLLGTATDASRVYMFRTFRDERNILRSDVVQEWVAPGLPARAGDPALHDLALEEAGLGRWEKLARGETIHGPISTLPEGERRFLESRGVCSVVAVPVFVGEHWWGVLGVTDDLHERRWDAAEIDALTTAAAMLGATLARRRTDEELRESEERFRQLAEVAVEGIVVHDNGLILDANASFARMFAYELDELIGRNFFEFMTTPESREKILSHIRSGVQGRYEVVGVRKDGSEIVVELDARPMMWRGRKVRVGTVHDVTERKHAEESTRRLLEEQAARAAAETAERRARFLAEASRVLSASFDYQTTLARLARLAVPELADFCVVDVIDGPTISRLGVAHVDPSKEPLLQEAVRYARLRGAATYHLRKPFEEGESVLLPFISEDALAANTVNEEHLQLTMQLRPHSLVSVPLRVGDRVTGALTLYMSESGRRYGPGDLALAEELARRAALSVENARLFHAAEQATRARDEMLGVVAHDLRNPLNTIAMGANLLTELIPEPQASLRKQAEVMRRAADRMNRLIQDLLDVRRIEAGRLAIEPRPQPAGALVDDAVEMLRPLASAGALALEADVRPDVPEVFADPPRVQQVLSNLVGNAIKFTPAGGRVLLGAEPMTDWEVRFCVADTGPGIAPEDLPHVFGQFWQARRTDRRGIGLGLAIAKGIVEAHGGRIWVESQVGVGSNFYFTLRAASSPG